MTEYYRDSTHINVLSDIDLSKVDELHELLAKWIREKMHGVDVREALARLVELTGSDVYDINQVSDELKKLTDKLSDEGTDTLAGVTVDSELIDARIDVKGIVYKTLKERLDAEQAILNSLNPNTEILSIKHDLKRYLKVNVLSWKYGIGTTGFATEETIFGTDPVTITAKVVYQSWNELIVYIPSQFGMENPEITKVSDTNYLIVEGINSLEIELY